MSYEGSDLLAAIVGGQRSPEATGKPKTKDPIVSVPDSLESALALANRHLSMLLDQGASMPESAQEEIVTFFDLARALAERERSQTGPPAQGGSQGMVGPTAAPGPGPALM